MSEPTDLSEVISEAATGPRVVDVDGVRTEEHSLKDLVAADQYLAAKNAAGKKHGGARYGKFVPPGAD